MKAIPELSVDTRLLVQRIEKMAVDEVVGFVELSALIGRNVAKQARSNLTSARYVALRTHGIVTEAVTRVGIKRLSDSAIIETIGPQVRQRYRRMATRGLRKLSTVQFDSLTDAQKIRQNAEISQLGALRAFSADKVTTRIESKVSGAAAGQLAIAKTLKAFEE